MPAWWCNGVLGYRMGRPGFKSMRYGGSLGTGMERFGFEISGINFVSRRVMRRMSSGWQSVAMMVCKSIRSKWPKCDRFGRSLRSRYVDVHVCCHGLDIACVLACSRECGTTVDFMLHFTVFFSSPSPPFLLHQRLPPLSLFFAYYLHGTWYTLNEHFLFSIICCVDGYSISSTKIYDYMR